jgi:DNA-binding transcriptional MerR regulator
MVAADVPRLKTIGVIAEILGVPQHRVAYLLRTRSHIRPTARAGRVRLFDSQAVAMLRHEISATDARNGGAA